MRIEKNAAGLFDICLGSGYQVTPDSGPGVTLEQLVDMQLEIGKLLMLELLRRGSER